MGVKSLPLKVLGCERFISPGGLIRWTSSEFGSPVAKMAASMETWPMDCQKILGFQR